MSKIDVNKNINNLFANLKDSSSLFTNPLSQSNNNQIKIPQNKTTSTTINVENSLIKGYSYHEDKNLKYRQAMEDAGTMTADLTNNYQVGLFCIFDGHGGTDVVNFIKERIPNLIRDNINVMTNVEKALEATYLKVDTELKFFDSENTGSTATTILIQGNKLYCANVGDSKAYIITKSKASQITTDHKCTNEPESSRIMSSGGTIQKGRVNGQLILSRSLGDLSVKKYGVIPNPSICVKEINKDFRFCVLASDGVWDVVDEFLLYDMSKEFKDADQFAKKIVKTAIEKGSKDNISCIVVSFV